MMWNLFPVCSILKLTDSSIIPKWKENILKNVLQEKFEDAKGIIRRRKSKDRHSIG